MPRFEVAGGIASGKTTFAHLFVGKLFSVLFENFRENPFWRKFYSDPVKYAFETEVAFLLQHYNQLRDADCDNDRVLLDTSLIVDRGYADTNLFGAEHAAFDAVYDVVESNLNPLDFLIWLRCGENEQMKRIAARGRAEESSITLKYLAQLNMAIYRRIDALNTDVTVMEIDSEELDFANDVQVQSRVVKDVLKMSDRQNGA